MDILDLSAKNYKKCIECKNTLPLSHFYKTKTGRRNKCKTCCRNTWVNDSYTKQETPTIFDSELKQYMSNKKVKKISYGQYLLGYCAYISKYKLIAISVHGEVKLFSVVGDVKLFLINETRKALRVAMRYIKP